MDLKLHAGYFRDRGFEGQGLSWVRMDHTDTPLVTGVPSVRVTHLRMVTLDCTLVVWHATFGDTYRNLIRWRSPGFEDPVSAYVYAELNQWGQ